MKPYIKPTRPHKHEGYHEIILITKGEGAHTIEFERHAVTPPVVFTLNTHQVHHWEFTEKPEGYVLMFKPEFLHEYSMRQSDELNFPPSLVLDKATRDRIQFLMEKIQFEQEEKQRNYLQSIAGYLSVLLIELERLTLTGKNEKPGVREYYRQFYQLALRHFREKKKVSDYADMLYITGKHLNTVCKESSGKTASNVLQNLINTEAKRLIIYTDKSIAELSLELGFEDASHFARFFKKHNGVSPKVFRRNRFE